MSKRYGIGFEIVVAAAIMLTALDAPASVIEKTMHVAGMDVR